MPSVEEAVAAYVAAHNGSYEWEAEELLREVARIQPRVVLEVGTHTGNSLRMWRAVADPELLMGIDIVPLPDGVAEELGVEFLLQDSNAPGALRWVKEKLDGRPIDFAYIDGDHTLEPVSRDWDNYWPLVRSGGLMVVHDSVITWNPTVDTYRFYEEVRKTVRSKLLFEGRGDPADPYCPTTGAALYFKT